MIMSLLNTKSLPALTGERVAVLKSYNEVENNQGGYINLLFQLEDREYNYSLFPGRGDAKGKQINYFMSAIRNQLGLKEGVIELGQILEAMKDKEIRIWFSYNSQYQRMNVEFHQSLQTEDTNLDEIEGA
jgi:hypothetical protein